MKTLTKIFIVGIIFIMSCKNEVVDSSKSTNLIPLSVGTKWVYKETYTTFPNENYPQIDTVTVTISSRKIIENITWYSIFDSKFSTNLFTSDTNKGLIAYSNINDNIYSRIVYRDSSSNYLLRYKYPVKIGDRFNSPFWITWNGVVSYTDTVLVSKVVSVDTLIKVPAGEYRCVLYRTSPHGDTTFSKSEEFVSPKIGLVRYDEVYHNGASRWRRLRDAISIQLK